MAKVATALVATLALSAGAHASDRVSQLAELEKPRDMISTFYQSLAAPGSNKLVIVSSKSADLDRMLATMPKSFAKLHEAQAEASHAAPDAAGFLRALRHSPEEAFNYRLSGKPLFGDRQAMCFVSAAEAVSEKVRSTSTGLQYYVVYPDRTLPTLHAADDMLYLTTIHELYHCAAETQYRFDAKDAFGPAGEYYGLAVDEMFADLAVVLNYAAKDGSYVNGMATVRGMRAAGLGDIEHNTEDMLDYVLSRLDASKVQGKQSGEIMSMVNQIARELDPIHNQALKERYSVSAAEKVMLSNQLLGRDETVSKTVAEVAQALHVNLDAAQPKVRAQKLIDALITLGVKNAAIHRDLGQEGFKQIGMLSQHLGIQLPVYQQARAAVFDVTVSEGANMSSPWPADAALKAGNRFEPLFAEHVQRMEMQSQQKPAVGLR